MNKFLEITTREQFLALTNDDLTLSVDWYTLFSDVGYGWGCPNEEERRARIERNRLGLDSREGIAKDSTERNRAWATISFMASSGFDRVRAVQIALETGCCAWHAGAVVYNKVDSCPCRSCQVERKAK